MDHHIARDLLGAYVDDEMEAPTRAALEEHLGGCEECRALLADHDEGAALPPATAPGWDERRMRRALRATLWNVAARAVLIAVVVLVAVSLLSAFVLQPLLVNRGDRVQRAAQASWDVPIMLIPGAFTTEWRMSSGFLSREFTSTVALYVGGQRRPLTDYGLHLGVTQARTQPLQSPYEAAFPDGNPPVWQPDHLPEGTVATVELIWDQPLPIARAQQLLPAEADATLVWASFAIDPLREFEPIWPRASVLGYSTCQDPAFPMLEGARRAGEISWTGHGTQELHGIDGALEQLRRATANLAGEADLERAYQFASPGLQRIDQVAAWLADHEPPVSSIVVTGPTDVLADLVSDAAPDRALTLDMDFYNWQDPVCVVFPPAP